MKAKPIIFSTPMVQAILADRKTQTRRVIKCKYSNTHIRWFTNKYGTRLIEMQNEEPGVTTIENPDGTTTRTLLAARDVDPKHKVGDVLWVRETWCELARVDEARYTHYDDCSYYYATDGDYQIDLYDADGFFLDDQRMKWKPSTFMPRAAARVFLRVIDVRAERLQDITEEDAKAEGVNVGVGWEEKLRHSAIDRYRDIWNGINAKPKPVKSYDGKVIYYVSYPWDDLRETRQYRGKPWHVIGNPWVWVYTFEGITKEAANGE